MSESAIGNCQPIINGRVISDEEFAKHELKRSRMALALLKERVGVDAIREAFREITDQRAREIAAILKGWDGQYVRSVVDIEIKGGNAEGFLSWFRSVVEVSNLHSLMDPHPEHYVVCPTGDGRLEVIETIGEWGLPSKCFVRLGYKPEEVATDPSHIDSSYPLVMAGYAWEEDGTEIARALHQFANTGTGFRVKLTIYWPSAFGAEFIAGHQWHLAIEFTNYANRYLAESGGRHSILAVDG